MISKWHSMCLQKKHLRFGHWSTACTQARRRHNISVRRSSVCITRKKEQSSPKEIAFDRINITVQRKGMRSSHQSQPESKRKRLRSATIQRELQPWNQRRIIQDIYANKKTERGRRARSLEVDSSWWWCQEDSRAYVYQHRQNVRCEANTQHSNKVSTRTKQQSNRRNHAVIDEISQKDGKNNFKFAISENQELYVVFYQNDQMRAFYEKFGDVLMMDGTFRSRHHRSNSKWWFKEMEVSNQFIANHCTNTLKMSGSNLG